MDRTIQELIDQLQEISEKLAMQHNEILKLPTSDFIRSFVALTTSVEEIDSLREVMLGRAQKLLSRPEQTERQMRKEHLKLVHNRK